MEKQKIDQHIIDKIKLEGWFNSSIDDILDYLYNYDYTQNYERNLNSYKYVFFDQEQFYEKTVKEAIEYMKTLDENCIITTDYDGDIECHLPCVESDDDYITRLVRIFRSIDTMIYNKTCQKKQLLKQKKELLKQIEELDKEINSI